jgi:hypothetical protein
MSMVSAESAMSDMTLLVAVLRPERHVASEHRSNCCASMENLS